MSRDLDCQYKTAFVLAHKLREALGSIVHNGGDLSGEVQVDGMYTGGHKKPENKKAERVDRRTVEERTGKRQVVVVAREVMGRTLPFVVPRESAAVPLIRKHVASGTIVHSDEGSGWDMLHASYDMRRVNHSAEYVAADGANVNQAESWFSRLRRAEYRRAPPDQRPASSSLRRRNGVARGSPPRAERPAMAADHRGRAAASDVAKRGAAIGAGAKRRKESPWPKRMWSLP